MTSRNISITKIAATAFALTLMLTGCDEPVAGQNAANTSTSKVVQTSNSVPKNTDSSAAENSVAETETPLPTAEEQQSATPIADATGRECADMTGQQALESYIHLVPKPFPLNTDPTENNWSMNSPTDTFDPCAEMSWIVLRIDRGTGSSPHQVMLFNKGMYIGRATDQSFGFAPVEVKRESGDIFITFRYTKEGESNAESSGRAIARYSWVEEHGRLERFGELPPGVNWAPQ